MFRNLDRLAGVLLAVWMLAVVMVGVTAGTLWVFPTLLIAFVAGAAFFMSAGWSA